MAYEDFDINLKYDTQFAYDFEESLELPYAEGDRWDITDILSSLWKGTGETARVFGRGTGIETLENVGEYISETEFAKPDKSTYLGEDSYAKQVIMGAAESLPTTAVLAGAGAVGSLAGPIGTVAGVGAAGAALSRGLYFDGVDRYFEQNPQGSEEDAHNYALMHSAVEGLTEVGGMVLGFGAMKFGGAIAKPFIVNAMEKGAISTAEVLDSVAAKAGGKEFVKKMFGATIPEGGEEVVASYLQDKIDKGYNMGTEDPDYFKTFLIGAVASGPFAVAGTKITNDMQNKIRTDLESGLKSEDKDTRLYTVKEIYDTIEKVSPEAAQNWDDYATVAASRGPIDLDAKVDTSLAWKENVSQFQKDRAQKKVEEEIIKDPQKILKDAGIPTKYSTNPYGDSPTAPPEASKIDKMLEKKADPTYWQKQLALWKQKESTPSYMKPYSPYDMSLAMKEVEEDTNTVPPPPPEPEVEPETKKTNPLKARIEAAKTAKAEAATAKAEAVEAAKTTTTNLKERQTARKAAETEMKVAEKGTEAKKTQAIAPEVEAKIKQDLIDWTAVADDTTMPEVERKKAKAQVEKLSKKLVTDTSTIPSGETTGVDASGKKTTVKYSTDKKDWKKVEGHDNVYNQGNGIIIKRNDNSYAAFQKDKAGKAVTIGEEFERMSHAIEALNEGLTKEEYYTKNPTKLKRKKAVTKVEEQKPLTEKQWEHVKSIKNVRTLVGSRVNKIQALRGDPEAEGIGTEAIIEAARKFKAGGEASFETFATGIIDSKLKQYNQDRYKNETQGAEISKDDGTTVSSLESVTREEVYETPATVVQEKAKEEAPPITKIDVSKLSPELLAQYGQGKKVEKKTKEQIKAELEARKQSEESMGKGADEPVDVKVAEAEAKPETKKEEVKKEPTKKAAGIKRTKKELTPLEKSKKAFMEQVKSETDLIALENEGVIPREMAKTLFDGLSQAETIDKKTKEEVWKVAEAVANLAEDRAPMASRFVIRKRRDTGAVPAKESDREDSRVLARQILDRANGDKYAASTVINAIKDTKTREEVRSHLESMEYMTVDTVLEPFFALDKSDKRYKLASFIRKLLNISGKDGIKVIVDPASSIDFFSPKKNVVVLRAVSANAITLHEVVHAITSTVISTNPEIRARIRSVMDLVEKSLLKNPKYGVTESMIKELRSIDSHSMAFHEKYGGQDDFGGTRGILYALLNEKEFLAQAMNDKAFQDILLETEVPVKKGFIKNMFDYVVQIFSEIFGVARIQHNAMKEVLQLIAETSRVDFSNPAILSDSIDGIFVGERARGIQNGTLLDAKFRESRGESLEDIWRDTGWFLDKDGSWKYEISDEDIEWDIPFEMLEDVNDAATEGVYKLGMVISHDKLFEAYPDIQEINLHKEDLGEGELGVYRPWNNTIAINKDLSSEEAIDTIVHEIQHLIQEKEGFAQGTNLDAVEIAVWNNLDKVKEYAEVNRNGFLRKRDYDSANIYETIISEIGTLEEHLESKRAAIREVKQKQAQIEAIEEQKAKLRETFGKILKRSVDLYNKLEKGPDKTEMGKYIDSMIEEAKERHKPLDKEIYEIKKEISQIKRRFPRTTIPRNIRYLAYRLTAGEAEARNVSRRLGLRESKRRETHPLKTLDVREELRIFSDDMGPVASASISKPEVKEKTWEERSKILAANDVRSTKMGLLKDFLSTKVKGALKDIGQGMTERLRQINPNLLRYVRKFEMAINDYNVKYQRLADPFVKKYKKMSRKDQRMLSLVLLNNFPEDVKVRQEILKRNNMTKEYENVVEVLKDIHLRKKRVGLGEYKEIPDYFPRTIRDRIGLLQAIKGDPNYGVIEQELNEAGLNEADRSKVIERLMDTGRYPSLAFLRPGSSKKRSIERVSSEWAHFYEEPVDSLLSHIYESNEAIEARRMFGDTRRKELVSKRDALLDSLEDDKLTKSQRKSIIHKVVKIEQDLEVYKTTEGKEAAWHQGISDLLSKEGHKLTANEQMEVISLIRARLLQKGMSGPIQTLRNISLMTALGNPTSAITQLSDFALSAHTNGLGNTGSSMFGDQLITTKDLDLSHSLREFQTQGSAAVLDKVLHFSGLKYMDIKAKNTFMNAAIKKAQKQSFETFEKEWGQMLGDETAQTFEDLKANKNTDLTRFFAFNALSEVQPTSLSEMPVSYLLAGNGRIFYALKSYNIKMINTYARKIYYGIKNANALEKAAKTPEEREKARAAKRKAITNGLTLLMVMTIAGATADELKDLIMRRDVDFSDNVHNNILKAFFMNTYMLEQGSKKGMIKTMMTDTLIPPTRMYDDMFKDATNLLDMDPDTETTLKTLKSLPWGGLVYAWTSKDAEKVNATNIKEDISSDIRRGASISEVRGKMLKYNKWARKSGESLITYSTIKNMRNRRER